MTNWIYSHSSVIGAGHTNTGIPCQDFSAVKESDDGKWLAIAVSDGAGSALHSDVSSNFVVNFFTESLICLSKELEKKEPGSWVNDYVISSVIKVRDELRNIANKDDLRDYHCTLIACLLGDSGGFLIHIGDGAAFGGKSIITETNTNYFSSLPENGEYSNETFFITESSWIKHIRITPFNSLDWILIASDGGTSLSMINDREPKWGFVAPLLNSIKNERNLLARNKKLLSILTDSQADKLTSDDKTICIAFRKDFSFDEDLTKPLAKDLTKVEEFRESDKLVTKEKKLIRLMLPRNYLKNKLLIKRVIKYTLIIFLLGSIFYMFRLGSILIKGFFN